MRILIRYLLLSACIVFLNFKIYAQISKTDSLENLFTQTNDSVKKVSILIKLGELYENTKPNTSIIYYDKAKFIAQKTKQSKGLISAYYKLGSACEILSKFDTSLYFYKKGLKLSLKINDTLNIANNYNGIGNIYYYKSNNNKAIVNYKKAIDYFKLLQTRDRFIGVVNHNIGLILQDIGQGEKAQEYYFKALKIFIKTNNNQMLSTCYNSIGTNFLKQEKYNEAIKYFNKSIKYSKKENDLFTQELVFTNLGRLYFRIGKLQKALENIVEAETIAEKINDKIGLADIYSMLSKLFLKLNNPYKSNIYAKKTLLFAKKINSAEYLRKGYLFLARSNINLKNFELAYYYLDSVMIMRDSIYEKSKVKDIAKVEAKDQNQQKQLRIENLEKQNKIDAAKVQKQRIIIISFIIGGLLIIVFIFFIIKVLQKIRKTNKLLNAKNDEIVAQRDEIETQRDAVLKQKQEIEIINLEVSQSIEYAKRIQTSIFPDEKILKKYLSDYFIFFKPKDVVSGDFYWWTHIDNHTIITVADCTGHGVPGAFMSMLGISLLREIVNKEYITHPGVILRKLRKEIIKALNQKGVRDEQKDGMDMALISINHETGIIQFSGANNPLYIIKSVITSESSERYNLSKKTTKQSSTDFSQPATVRNDEFALYEIKPDKMPISVYMRMDNFTTHEIQLKKGDQLYMFSDGFADQFGGSKGKKFKYKPFKHLLLENTDKPVAEQKEIIKKTFMEWKNNLQQVDDITIVGIKI